MNFLESYVYINNRAGLIVVSLNKSILSIGQVMDSSPVAGPLDALGFSESEDNRNTCLYRMPIVGYEVLEERSRFTVSFHRY